MNSGAGMNPPGWRFATALISTIGRALLAITCVALVIWNGMLAHLMVTTLRMNDFGKFYYSAVLFLRGDDMYGPSPATALPVPGLEGLHGWNMNPPHAHLPLLPLAKLSPGLALALWGAASVLSLAIGLRLIARELGLVLGFWERRLALVALLGFAGTGAVIATGQLSLLLLLPITIGWIEARHDRWIRAGAWIGGAMSVKPFLLVFVPYLLLARRARAAAAACAVWILCFAAGVLVFGLDAHRSWLGALGSVDWAWVPMNGSVLGFLARGLTETPFYSPLISAPSLVTPIWATAALIIGVLTLAASATGPPRRPIDHAFALLMLGALLISPLGSVYYLWLPLGPLLAIWASWRVQEQTSARCHVPRAARLLLPVAGVALMSPTILFNIPFKRHPWAWVSVGSAYFWATLLLWIIVLADWYAAGGRLALLKWPSIRRGQEAPGVRVGSSFEGP
jgi:hypothetical protein